MPKKSFLKRRSVGRKKPNPWRSSLRSGRLTLRHSNGLQPLTDTRGLRVRRANLQKRKRIGTPARKIESISLALYLGFYFKLKW
jgi:hypothetical protein